MGLPCAWNSMWPSSICSVIRWFSHQPLSAHCYRREHRGPQGHIAHARLPQVAELGSAARSWLFCHPLRCAHRGHRLMGMQDPSGTGGTGKHPEVSRVLSMPWNSGRRCFPNVPLTSRFRLLPSHGPRQVLVLWVNFACNWDFM